MTDETALATREEPGQVLSMIERLATNPDVDVEKLKGLMDLQERMIDRQAEAEFWADFAQMQTELPEIDERGEILNKGKVQSTYATFEDIQDAVRPILQKFGFALSFRFAIDGASIQTTGILAHRSGHKEETTFSAPVDDSGAKNRIQGVGSAHSYGKRYTTAALLNLTTRGEDDDGQRTGRKSEAPEGYEAWLEEFAKLASDGRDALEAAWGKQPDRFRKYLTEQDRQRWERIKRAAEEA